MTVNAKDDVTQGSSGGVLSNDRDPDGDTLKVLGVAAGLAPPSAEGLNAKIVGTYGELTMHVNGNYQYRANGAASLSLLEGQSAQDVFTYQISDGKGGMSTTTLTIIVRGAASGESADEFQKLGNVAVLDIATVTENQSVIRNASTGLLLNDTDADGDKLTVIGVATGSTTNVSGNVATPLLGTYGSLTVASDGSYSYVADTAAANALKLGETQQEVFSYQISDGQGGTSITTLSITITGANDRPVATVDVGSVDENAELFVTALQGLLRNDGDVDGDRLLVTGVAVGNNAPATNNLGVPLVGTYGTLTVASDGSYSYAADTAAADALKVGQTQQEIFSYQISDGQGGTSITTLSITITGANDLPIATRDTGAVYENASLTLTAAEGLLKNDSDVDGDRLVITGLALGNTVPNSANLGTPVLGVYGVLTLASDGGYSYVANTEAANGLKVGETQQDVFTYQLSDGQGGVSTTTLTITVTGTNDQPVANADQASVIENQAVTRGAGLGVLANDTDSDQDILTVTGVVVGVAMPTEGGLSTPLTGTYGTLILASDGSYSYYANTEAANQLKEGEVQTETFTYRATDSKGDVSFSTLVLSITGTNDSPVAVADVHHVDATALVVTQTFSGSVLTNDTDVDGDILVIGGVAVGTQSPDMNNIATALQGTYGQLTLGSDGSYVYVANNTNSLTTGQTGADIFTYQINDGHGGMSVTTLTMVVEGNASGGGSQGNGAQEGGGLQNSIPLATADFANVNEDETVTRAANQGVLQNDSDPDGNQLLVTNVGAGTAVPTLNLLGSPVAGEFGHLLLHSDGSYSYTADAAKANKLAQGAIATDTFTYVVSDGHGGTSSATLNIAITGTNDGPVANSSIVGLFPSFIGSEGVALEGTSGRFGGYTYGQEQIAKTFDFGAENAGKTVAIDVSMVEIDSWDGGKSYERYEGESFRVFANGELALERFYSHDTQDGVYLGNAIGYSGYRDELNSLTLDVTLDANGQVRLGFGSTIHQDYNDESWAVDRVALTLNGTNITQVDNFDGQSEPWLNLLRLSNRVGDVDLNDSVTLTGIAAGAVDMATGQIGSVVIGQYGQLTVQADGSYFYQANPNAVAHLAQGQMATDVFTYTVRDAFGACSSASLHINAWGIAGSQPPITAHVMEDTTLTANGQVQMSTTSFLAQTATVGQFGTFTLATDGSWSYVLDNNKDVVQDLQTGQEVADAFMVTTADGQTNIVSVLVHGLDAIPEGTSKTIMYGNETGLYQVSASDFGFQANEDGTSLAGVRLLNLSLGVSGFILHDGQQQPLPINQFISVEDIEAGRVFLTGLSPNGVSTGNVSFEVQDSNGNLDPTPNMLTLNCVSDQSPLILDLDGNGVQTVGLNANIHFDINADGTQEQTGWVGANDAFLVVDRNQNGTIDDGSELFGNNTRLANGDKAANGFAALADYDSNQDGIIDANDEKFAQLKVWRDANQDGKSDASELFGLETAGVHSLNLDFTNSDKVVAGNRYAQVGSYTTATGATAEMTDVWFSTKTEAAKPSKLELRDLFHNDEHVPLPAAAANVEAEANQVTRPATTLGHTDPHAVDAHSGAAHQELHHLMQELLHKPHSLD